LGILLTDADFMTNSSIRILPVNLSTASSSLLCTSNVLSHMPCHDLHAKALAEAETPSNNATLGRHNYSPTATEPSTSAMQSAKKEEVQ
jgi:hypothetical protein